MSRNLTRLFVMDKCKIGNYRIFKTVDKARKYMPTLESCFVIRERYTPSGEQVSRRESKKLFLHWRKTPRREADAKKMMERMNPRGGAIDWLERERINRDMSQWQFERYAAGVRKGTIL